MGWPLGEPLYMRNREKAEQWKNELFVNVSHARVDVLVQPVSQRIESILQTFLSPKSVSLTEFLHLWHPPRSFLHGIALDFHPPPTSDDDDDEK